MTTVIRRGNDCLLYLKLKANNTAFSNVKSSNVYLVHTSTNHCSGTEHKPTETATNICCNQRVPTHTVELTTGPIKVEDSIMTVEALIPANLLVSGVYRLIASWFIDHELEAYKTKGLTYTQDFTDTITVTDDNTTGVIPTSITYTQDITITNI